MTTSPGLAPDAVAAPTFDDIVLGRGAMQNWSDLNLGSVGDSPLIRGLLDRQVDGAASCLVVGSHSAEFVRGLRLAFANVSVVTRSIPDALALRAVLGDSGGVTVYCASLGDLAERGLSFDLVIAFDDLDRVVSLESEPPSWAAVLGQLRAMLAVGGRLLLGIENELGLHRLASLRSRYARNDDADWAVLSMFDATRPRTPGQIEDAFSTVELSLRSVHATYSDWLRPSAILKDAVHAGSGLLALLSLVVAGAPSRGRLADPSRLTRAAAASGLLAAFASGWVVEAIAGEVGEAGASPELVVDTDQGLIEFTESGGVVQRHGSEPAQLQVTADSTLLLEDFADACAAHRLPEIRRQLAAYAGWLTSRADADGHLDATLSAASFRNVVRTGVDWTVLLPGTETLSVDERIRRSLGGLVAALRESGNRTPWPAATDDLTLIRILAAMAGAGPVDHPAAYVGSAGRIEGPAHSVAGLLAVVERLAESNRALESRASWFERRLGERERELRAEQAHQQSLRRAISDIKGSLTFRTGQAITSPVVRAREKARKLRR